MKVGVIGTGHVGLPTAATLAHLGHHVVATDADVDKIEMLKKGETPFFEPGMGDLVREGLDAGRLSFEEEPAAAVQGARVVFICVGTPPRATGEANLVAVEQAALGVAAHATGELVVVEKSTVPAGTADRLSRILNRSGHAIFHVVSSPEFLREGSAIADSLSPDRILIGSDSEAARDIMRELYAPLIDKGTEWIVTDVRTAELAKHACNAFLALKISFANAMARICELANADVVAVADVMGSDPRIGRAFLDAGLGYGGYCFPKDLAAFDALSSQLGYDFPLLREVARINDDAVDAAFAKIIEAVWNLEGKRIALLGLAFKPGTDDTRLSPPLALARKLIDAGAQTVGYDPQANRNAKAEVPELTVVDDVFEALADAHCAVVCTEWDEFRTIDLAQMREAMDMPVVVDARNIFDPKKVAAAGFTYFPMGRPSTDYDPTAA